MNYATFVGRVFLLLPATSSDWAVLSLNGYFGTNIYSLQ